MTDKTVHKYAQQLRDYATHFAMRDWEYTRNITVKRLYTESFKVRLLDTVKWGWRGAVKRTRRRIPLWERELNEAGGKVSWWRMTEAHWRYHNHLPDGMLDQGNILTHWEETGEYLQYVQPSIGALLADLMDNHPDLPEVQAIAVEMERIQKDYARRAKEAGWDE